MTTCFLVWLWISRQNKIYNLKLKLSRNSQFSRTCLIFLAGQRLCSLSSRWIPNNLLKMTLVHLISRLNKRYSSHPNSNQTSNHSCCSSQLCLTSSRIWMLCLVRQLNLELVETRLWPHLWASSTSAFSKNQLPKFSMSPQWTVSPRSKRKSQQGTLLLNLILVCLLSKPNQHSKHRSMRPFNLSLRSLKCKRASLLK